MKQGTKHGNLSWIREELERRLIVMRYSEVTAGAYIRIFGWVEDFLIGYGEVDYSKELGELFIAEYSLNANHAPTQYKHAQTLIRRLDEILENKLIAPRFGKPSIECPPRFIKSLDNYLEHSANTGCRESTLAGRKRYVGQFLYRIPDTIDNLKDLTAQDLYTVFKEHEWVSSTYSIIRGFLTFLFTSRITKANLSVCVPKPKRQRALPSVYSGDEVAQLLASVDRTTTMGKRDYAVLMLAAHLGLRSSDIVNLSFADIDYASKTIQVTQVKTERPLTLVMNSDVEEAIVDYIKNGRPQSSVEKIFLGSKAPFNPICAGSGFAITQRYFSRAGIAPQGRRRGPHALRTSYATALVAKGVPYAVVQEALGHEDPESAKHYVRVDIRRLRMCALDVPKPTGTFAVMLGDLEVVL